jgi:hypothetical protein
MGYPFTSTDLMPSGSGQAPCVAMDNLTDRSQPESLGQVLLWRTGDGENIWSGSGHQRT